MRLVELVVVLMVRVDLTLLIFVFTTQGIFSVGAGTSHAGAVNGNGEVFLWGNNKDTQVTMVTR